MAYNNTQTYKLAQAHTCIIISTTHTHTMTTRTCWPDLLPRGEMRSNSAFQHTTSDYLFSFTGFRFELVILCSPFFLYGTPHLSVSHVRRVWEPLLPRALGQKRWKRSIKIHRKTRPPLVLCCHTEIHDISKSVLSTIVIYCTSF